MLRSSVAEVVEADRRQAGLFQEWLEGAVSEIRGVDDRARLRGKDKSARLVEGAQPLRLLELAGEMVLQRPRRSSLLPLSRVFLLRLTSAPGWVDHVDHPPLYLYVLGRQKEVLVVTVLRPEPQKVAFSVEPLYGNLVPIAHECSDDGAIGRVFVFLDHE